MAYPGKHAGVFIANDLVAEINDATFTINGEIVDISSFDSGGWRERLLNLRDASISISGFYVSDDTTGQNVLRTAILTQALVEDVKVLADVNVATSGFICDAFVETFEINAAVEGAVTVSISLQSSGQIAVSS
jgi:TP901-1 family phage major tail protein